MSEERDMQWYVVHTYSGHENKVKTTIENTVKNRGMENIIESEEGISKLCYRKDGDD